MPAAVPLLGAAATVYGASQARSASRDAARAQSQALQQSQTQLNPFSIFGLGGMGASYGAVPTAGVPTAGNHMMPTGEINPAVASILGRIPGGFGGAMSVLGAAAGGAGGQPAAGGTNGINLSAGDLEGVRAALSQFASSGVPGSGNSLPPAIAAALGGLNQARGAPVDLGTGGLDLLSSGVNNAFMDAAGSLGGAGDGTQNTAFRGAYDRYYDDTLATLRSNADVANQRGFSNLQDSLFSTGRLGSSGGALQTEAFARGLAQNDSNLQMQAHDVSRNLMNDAFGRFATSAGIASDLNTQRFARSMYGDQRDYGRAQDWLGTNVSLAGLPSQLQGAQLQNVLAALQGQSGISDQALNLFNAGLSAESAAANARIGAGSNIARIVGSPTFGAPAQAGAGMWAQLGGALMNQNGLGGVLGSIFGSGGGGFTDPGQAAGTGRNPYGTPPYWGGS